MKKLLLLLRAVFPALLLTLGTLGTSAALVSCAEDAFEEAGEDIDEAIDDIGDELD